MQALYAWDLRDDTDLDVVASRMWDDLGVAPVEREFAGKLLRIVMASGAALDEELADVTTNWRLERLGAIERCVLRLGAAELEQGVTPPRVVLQEMVRLAERYGSAPSARFVNGVLDALARRMGRLP
ncbi:MAG: transcription antitermination factor NusB [Gemmatimonadetes bacterium]|nr:transcription antitermination factor NusB [Gemmatimonadota bacterium]